jgi:hypothetical protein
MSILDRLRHEHDLFRSQLSIFESVMAKGGMERPCEMSAASC